MSKKCSRWRERGTLTIGLRVSCVCREGGEGERERGAGTGAGEEGERGGGDDEGG